MVNALLFFHSLFRWLLLAALLYALYRAYRGYVTHRTFSKTDNAVRHWTATIAHIQLAIGILLYTQSPVVGYFFKHFQDGIHQMPVLFFGLVHMVLMLAAIVLITIGSALAKRRILSRDKFRIMGIWYLVALCIIFVAIPWPFSPLAGRPYLRPY